MTAIENNNVLARIALADFYRDGYFIKPDVDRETKALRLRKTDTKDRNALNELLKTSPNLLWKWTLRHFTIESLPKEKRKTRKRFLKQHQEKIGSATNVDSSDKVRFKILYAMHILEPSPNPHNLSQEYAYDTLRNDPNIYPEDRTDMDIRKACDLYLSPSIMEMERENGFKLFTQVSKDTTAWPIHRFKADLLRAYLCVQLVIDRQDYNGPLPTFLTDIALLDLIKKVVNSGFKISNKDFRFLNDGLDVLRKEHKLDKPTKRQIEGLGRLIGYVPGPGEVEDSSDSDSLVDAASSDFTITSSEESDGEDTDSQFSNAVIYS